MKIQIHHMNLIIVLLLLLFSCFGRGNKNLPWYMPFIITSYGILLGVMIQKPFITNKMINLLVLFFLCFLFGGLCIAVIYFYNFQH